LEIKLLALNFQSTSENPRSDVLKTAVVVPWEKGFRNFALEQMEMLLDISI
jgi:hypothetical protein